MEDDLNRPPLHDIHVTFPFKFVICIILIEKKEKKTSD